MFNRISDALYRTLGKILTLVGIVLIAGFVFRYIKELLKNMMREKKVKKMIRWYFREKKLQEESPQQ
jgi:hypothetical protein